MDSMDTSTETTEQRDPFVPLVPSDASSGSTATPSSAQPSQQQTPANAQPGQSSQPTQGQPVSGNSSDPGKDFSDQKFKQSQQKNSTPITGAPPADTQTNESVKRAGVLRNVAETLAGGQNYRYQMDVNTGQQTRIPVPLSKGQIAMAIALEALTGGLAGMAAGRGRGIGAAGMAGVQQGENIVNQRRQQEAQDSQEQQANFARAAQVAHTNMMMAQNHMALASADHDLHQKNVDGYASLYKMAQDAHGVDKIVSEDDLQKMLTDNDAHVTRNMAIPIRVVESVGADGKPALQDGHQKYEYMYAVVKPDAKLTLPPDVLKLLQENKVPGYVDGDGKPIDLPKDLETRMSMMISGIEQANSIRFAQAAFDGYTKGQTNPLHQDTAPSTPAKPTKVPEIKDAKTASLIDDTAKKYGIDNSIARALVMEESGGKHEDGKGKITTSDKGAIGLMQLMPSTAKGLNVDPTNLEQNVDGGMRYLKSLIDKNGGDVRKALVAYHGAGSDGHTTGAEYADAILNRAGAVSTDKGGKADDAFPKPKMSVADALQQHVLTTDDLRTMQQIGGLNAFLNGNPKTGELSTAQKMAEQHPDKVSPQSVGRIVQFMGGQDAIDAYRVNRMQQFEGLAAENKQKQEDQHQDRFWRDAGIAKDTNLRGTPLLQELYKHNVAVGADVEKISNYNMRERDIGNRAGERQFYFALASMVNPDFDSTNLDQKVEAKRRFTDPNGKTAQGNVALSTALAHMQRAYDNVSALATLPGVRSIAELSGNASVAAYNTDKEAIANEIGKAYKMGVIDIDERKSWLSRLESMNPTTVRNNLRELAYLLEGKMNATYQQYKSAVPGDRVPAIISPDAAQSYKHITGDDVHSELLGTAASVPQSAMLTGKPQEEQQKSNWQPPAGSPSADGVPNGKVLKQGGRVVAVAKDGQWTPPTSP